MTTDALRDAATMVLSDLYAILDNLPYHPVYGVRAHAADLRDLLAAPLASETTDSLKGGYKAWYDRGYSEGLLAALGQMPLASETTDAGLDVAWEALADAVQYISAHGLIDAAEWFGIEKQYRPRIEAALSSSGSIDAERLARALHNVSYGCEYPSRPSRSDAIYHKGHAAQIAAEYARLSESVE